MIAPRGKQGSRLCCFEDGERPLSSSIMMFYQNIWCVVVFCCMCGSVRVSGDVVSEFTERSPVSDTVNSLNPLAALGDYSDISRYCKNLLERFGDEYVAYVNCLVPAARPVKVCQNCFLSFETLNSTYANISSDDDSPGGELCRDSLLRSDRLMLVFLLFSNLEGIWAKSNCINCISKDAPSLTNDTLYFLEMLNQTYSCFDQYQQGNHTELCKKCKNTYQELTSLYGNMENNNTMCIDIEDAMNVTRRRWSKTFNCSFPREENVPIIAVSSFMLFLPIIFYLSSFLHSEQKKRKLIQPKRAPQYSSLMNIQDKLS